MKVTDAVSARRSVRAFTSKPVSRKLVESLLEHARWAPSGGNLQPWNVHVVAGERLESFKSHIVALISQYPGGTGSEYPVYPAGLEEPYRSRRFACGMALYDAIGIDRSDRAGRSRQFAENFRFFGAPAALFITLDRSMQEGQWSDLGMFIQTFMLLATEAGLGTCAQESWSVWHQVVADEFSIPDEHMLFCGVAIGYEDKSNAINQWRTERAGLDEFVQWHGL